MSYEKWGDVFTRINNRQTEDFDAFLAPYDARVAAPGTAFFPDCINPTARIPLFKDPHTACVGFRVTEKPDDIADIAMRLTALAMEKEVEIIIFNHLDYSGFERFGFRCENVAGQTPAEIEACENQIKCFWNIDLVL
jgi:hypothetical protein